MTKKTTGVIHAAGGIVWKIDGKNKKIAIVHRHKHNDWSLPKGKLDSGEKWKKAALREVLEETGCKCKIKEYAGSISYLLNGKPKIVLFWHMDIKSMATEKMNGEVDQIRWLTVEEALDLLDYEDEKELIQSGPYQREKGT